MTEKRFKLYSEVGFIDTQKCSGDTMTLFEVVVELNKLNEENEQLKSEIEKLSYANEDLLEEKRIWKQMSDEYTKLSDENEQLKQTNQRLNDELQVCMGKLALKR